MVTVEFIEQPNGEADKAIMESHACQCSACERAREQDEANTRAAQLEAALKAVEWRVSGCHLQCLWCHGIKEYEGHRPDCARQAALAPPEQREGE